MHRTYFWRQNKDKNSIPVIAWDIICTPKAYEGLGLRKILPLNKAYIAKLGWKNLTGPTNIWVQLIKAKNLHDESFFNYSPKPHNCPIWRNILKQRPSLRKGIRWKIGDGTHILFWLHNWGSSDSLLNMLLLSLDQVNISLCLSHFILPTRHWDLKKLSNLFTEHILKIIKGIRLPKHPIPDEPIWGPSSLGELAIK